MFALGCLLGQIFNKAPEIALWVVFVDAVTVEIPGVAVSETLGREPSPSKSSLRPNTSPWQVEHALTVMLVILATSAGWVDHPMPATRADPSYDLIGDGQVSEIRPFDLHADSSAYG